MIGNEKMRSFGIRVFSFFFVLFFVWFLDTRGGWIRGGGKCGGKGGVDLFGDVW